MAFYCPIASFLHQFMNYQTGTEFRFEPGGFRRHNVTGIGNVNQLFHRNGIQRQCHFHFAAVNPFLQFTQSAYAADKVNTLVAAKVFEPQNFIQNKIGGNSDIKHTNRIMVVVRSRFGCERIPVVVQI